MITPEQLARSMQNKRYGQNYLPPSKKQWEDLNHEDQEVLLSIARNVIYDIEQHKQCNCEQYPSMRQLALDLKHVLDKYC